MTKRLFVGYTNEIKAQHYLTIKVYVLHVYRKLISNFEAKNKETPQQLEPESKNGVVNKIKNV